MFEKLHIKVLSSEVVDRFAGESKRTGDRRRYNMLLSYNGKEFRFPFYDSIYNYCKNKKLNKKDTIYAILMDSNAVESVKNEKEFIQEFGYDEFDLYESSKVYRKDAMYSIYAKEDVDTLYAGIRAYKECLKTNKALKDMFTSEELSRSIGKTRMVLAIVDLGFYKSIKKYLGGVENEG